MPRLFWFYDQVPLNNMNTCFLMGYKQGNIIIRLYLKSCLEHKNKAGYQILLSRGICVISYFVIRIIDDIKTLDILLFIDPQFYCINTYITFILIRMCIYLFVRLLILLNVYTQG